MSSCAVGDGVTEADGEVSAGDGEGDGDAASDN
jgi:hypothetical protein